MVFWFLVFEGCDPEKGWFFGFCFLVFGEASSLLRLACYCLLRLALGPPKDTPIPFGLDFLEYRPILVEVIQEIGSAQWGSGLGLPSGHACGADLWPTKYCDRNHGWET